MSPQSRRLATLVYPAFRHGLRLKERLRLGRFDMHQEQAELKRLVKNAEAASLPDPGGPAGTAYLGAGYPLACWLDEIFILDPGSPWRDEWREQSLETALYGSRDRAFQFWAQAEMAERRGDIDALEVFYLCVMLGFRGDREGDPYALEQWRERVETHLVQARATRWDDEPPEKPIPPADVPPLVASEQLRRLLLTAGVLVAVALVGLSFAATRFGLTER
jgi:type VI secretion system protein ImpK